MKVKICGVTNPDDAKVATAWGADFVGMIMWQKAGRAVSAEAARAIADAASAGGALPVGVFVEEGAEEIAERCRAAGLRVAQLHGDNARAALNHLPPSDELSIIYVIQVTPEGELMTPLPEGRKPEWVLLDGEHGGSGQKLNWDTLPDVSDVATNGWFLAGGLSPCNVGDAVATAHPTGVDVSTGVCVDGDIFVKDGRKVASFVASARTAAGGPKGSAWGAPGSVSASIDETGGQGMMMFTDDQLRAVPYDKFNTE
ncbi:unnamed protein product [Pedinophyceae sp. YPF-701]|nr:unnamed protein product [Pedinophyceae sp. YPF-701]